MNFHTSEVDRLRDAAGKLLVRRAVHRNDWIAQAIFDIAAGDKKHWTTHEWRQVLTDFEACRLRVNDWLDLNV